MNLNEHSHTFPLYNVRQEGVASWGALSKCTTVHTGTNLIVSTSSWTSRTFVDVHASLETIIPFKSLNIHVTNPKRNRKPNPHQTWPQMTQNRIFDSPLRNHLVHYHRSCHNCNHDNCLNISFVCQELLELPNCYRISDFYTPNLANSTPNLNIDFTNKFTGVLLLSREMAVNEALSCDRNRSWNKNTSRWKIQNKLIHSNDILISFLLL